MMASNLKESLLARSSPPASSSPPRTTASGCDDEIKTDGTPPRLPPPPPPPPSPSLPADMAKSESPRASSSPPRTTTSGSDDDVKTNRTPLRLPPPPPSPSLPVDMAKSETSASYSPSTPSASNANVANNLSSPTQPSPPAASDERSSDSRKPVGVEKVIGIFGFSLFGSISLLPSTMDRIKEKELPDGCKTALMMIFGLIWIVASAGVLSGLHGKTDFEQAVCRHTGRLSMFGLALLVILHVRWTLPAGIGFDIPCYILACVAFLVHVGSWIASCIVGEDRIDDAAPGDAQH